jgi:uncharacterized protein (TIGR02246 family)
MTKIVATCAVLTLVLAGFAPPASADESETAAVRAVLDQVVRAWDTNDVSLISGIIAHDSDMVSFGTDAAERFVGWDALKASIEKQFTTYTGTKAVVKHRDIKLAADGSVAWAAEVMDVSTHSGSEAVALEGMRVTSVLEKRGGKWLIVQFHYSMPVAGQAIKY